MTKRKSDKTKPILVMVGLSLIAVGLILMVTQLSSNYLDKQSKKSTQSTQKCSSKSHSVHEVIIQNDKAVPAHTSANFCDTLIITNLDDKVKLMAFGEHEDHQPYDGVTEKALQKGQDLTVTLNQTGTFTFHDHIGDQAHGTFTVSK